jgi:hypothetical protein
LGEAGSLGGMTCGACTRIPPMPSETMAGCICPTTSVTSVAANSDCIDRCDAMVNWAIERERSAGVQRR